ncbi:hypothetical protein DAPPUDRAFT_108189 [Daphnia pulex]|uniref:Uncharacterized protein n=1 Tax=Daphnia pulex TaxID=6669 RepID=E9GZE9_DAPPU|nr:hypothetical protein DAPPUDRAFT_108189 [Daphnia pulex]|eukprot:EFX75137.1 hypothetical protein DAPPUDRAFT_108189 [Daphnia pulex]
MNSVTGSRKTIEVVNKLGHGINYHVTEEQETELTYSTTDKSKLLPWGLQRHNQLGTGVAFDNYDQFVETLTGKDPLRDTVRIVYQDLFEGLQVNPEAEDGCSDVFFRQEMIHDFNVFLYAPESWPSMYK